MPEYAQAIPTAAQAGVVAMEAASKLRSPLPKRSCYDGSYKICCYRRVRTGSGPLRWEISAHHARAFGNQGRDETSPFGAK